MVCAGRRCKQSEFLGVFVFGPVTSRVRLASYESPRLQISAAVSHERYFSHVLQLSPYPMAEAEAEAGYDLALATVDPAELDAFMSVPLNQDLLVVPGMDSATKGSIINGHVNCPFEVSYAPDYKVTSSHELIHHYLALRMNDLDECISVETTNEKFWSDLHKVGVPPANLHRIIYAIHHKVKVMCPFLFVE